MKPVMTLLLALCISIGALAQTETPAMADALRADGMIYVVIAVIVIVFAGLAIYLFSMDRRLKKIEKNNPA